MESTGVPNKIQVSQETADLLKVAGKGGWLEPRKSVVSAKGKGKLQTYFLKIVSGSPETEKGVRSSQCIIPQDLGNMALADDSKTERLIDWNVEVLSGLIRKIVARRAAASVVATSYTPAIDNSRIPLDEVAPIILLPEFDPNVLSKQVDPDRILLDSEVANQLKALVTQIAKGYHPNPFHNFEHAVSKLIILAFVFFIPANMPRWHHLPHLLGSLMWPWVSWRWWAVLWIQKKFPSRKVRGSTRMHQSLKLIFMITHMESLQIHCPSLHVPSLRWSMTCKLWQCALVLIKTCDQSHHDIFEFTPMVTHQGSSWCYQHGPCARKQSSIWEIQEEPCRAKLYWPCLWHAHQQNLCKTTPNHLLHWKWFPTLPPAGC